MINTLLFGLSALSVLVTSGSILRLSPLASSLLLLFCLLGVALITVGQMAREALSQKYVWPLLAFSLFLLFSQLQPEVKPVLAQACVLALLSVILSIPALLPEHRCIRMSIVWTLFAFFVLNLAVEISSPAWFLIEWYARQVSSHLAKSFGLSVQLGPTAMGLSGLVLCIIYTWARISPSLRQLWGRGVAVTLALLCLNHFGAIFLAWLAHAISQWRTAGMSWALVAEWGFTALDFVPILFMLECLVLYVFLDRKIVPDVRQAAGFHSSNKAIIIKYAIPCFLFVCIAYSTSQWPIGDYDGRIVLYQGGMTSWSKPDFERLGSSNRPGLFCVLPDYLRSFGFEVELAKDVSSGVLEDADVFVVMNFNEKWEEEKYVLLSNYVKNGGTLMVFADHTDMSDLMKRSNDLLSETPIRINFDSAHFLNNYWNDAFVTRLHPINRKNWDKNGIGVSVGASLRLLNHRAIPVLVARYGFSDKGNRNDALSRNYIGDRIYNMDEMLGDILLAAESKLGDGKFIVFGDTALLQAGALPYCHRYVSDLFKWGVHGKSSYFPWGLVLVLVLIATLWIAKTQQRPFVIAVAMILSTSLGVFVGEAILHLSYTEHQYNGRIAYLDHAHVALCDHEGYAKEDGDSYLVDNLIRNGFIPMAWKEFNRNALEKSALMISMATTKPYSRKERGILDEFMKRGGQLLVLSGDRCAHATKDFLELYGIRILPTPPLGGIAGGLAPEDNSERISMYSANPISVEGLQKEEVLCTAFDKYPVVVERKVGQGKLTVVGDYGLFFNGRLEKLDWASPENIYFLRKLIGTAHEDEQA